MLVAVFVKMKPNKFKVLTYLGNYVDERLLPNGLYFTSKPVLHSEEQTIDAMIKMHEDFHNMQGVSFGIKDTIDNLKKCSLTIVELAVVK